MQTGVAERAAAKGASARRRAGAASKSSRAPLKIAFIYRGDPRHRTANRLSMSTDSGASLPLA